MASPMRLDPELVRAAEARGRLEKRSTPRQIEYWAELGRQLAGELSLEDVLAVRQGLARIRVEPVEAAPVDSEAVFARVDELREDGGLYEAVTDSDVYFEPSRSNPGMLDRVHPDGRRETGMFRDGEFRVAHSA